MSRWPNKYVIGLTGNIAVGKSVVRQMLQHSGAYTIDADNLAHQAMMPGAPAYDGVVQTFGQVVIGPDGRINRQMLASIVFSSPDMLKKLEEITHPIIRQAIHVLVSRAKQRVVVIEAIKLLEGELVNMVDEVWVVDARPQTQYKRLVVKRKMSQEDAKRRILAQSPQAEKLRKADVVIQNDGNVEETWRQVQERWSEIRKLIAHQAQASTPEKSADDKPEKPVAAAQSQPDSTQDNGAQEDIEQAKPTSIEGVSVKRGMPGNAALIAEFISKSSGKDVSRMDVMLSFGQKSYFVAQNDNEDVVGLLGWTVENLVTRMDEFYLESSIPVGGAVEAIIAAVEEASKELQSEVGFIFLSKSTSDATLQAFRQTGYEPITLKEIKVPAWREAVEEALRDDDDKHVLWKQLRKDRVLQPI